MAIQTAGREFDAAVARALAVKMQVVGDLARVFGQPEPFASDADRVARLKAAATVPASCGPEIIPAPARGAAVRFTPVSVQPRGADGYEVQHAGYRGRDAARAADVFDRIEASARRSRSAMPFSPGQIEAARRYRGMVERHDAGGIKLASLEGRGAGGSGGDFMDAYLSEAREIARMRAAIGSGMAMVPRRRGSGGAARAVSLRAAVDALCLDDLTPGEVLRRFGWSEYGANRDALRRVLAEALERMRG
ncbi:MAG: hypothetical protein IE922_01570 [Sphingomonadales bacterium]|nr:hypothetical protein [Sphingomonadales bacterium]